MHSENECIMELFKGQSLLEFTEHFKTDLDCEEYLASIKWEKGYCCRKCGHKKYQVRKDLSRTCNICGDTESPTAGTLFHRLKFGLRKAFFICFEMTTTSLRTIFDKHIDKTAYITTDEWKGYRPIKDFNITQKPSNEGKNCRAFSRFPKSISM